MSNAIELNNITKAFGPTSVLKGITFNVKKGNIHALLGENGTGKSTLMNILTGIITRDSGEIRINRKIIDPYHDKWIAKQITFIHQELSLVKDLTIYENLFLGHELTHYGKLDRMVMIRRAHEVLEQMGLSIDPTTKVRDLNPSLKQMVEVGRGLINEAKIIIMDEPTSALDNIEIQALFKVMRILKQDGITIIFISHKLNEVLSICDSYTVMRDGYVVQTGEVTNATTERELSALMVGKKLIAMTKSDRSFIGKPVLELQHLSKQQQFEDINLHVDAGEVVGVTGLLGDGRSELFQTVVGANDRYHGKIIFNGKLVKMNNTQAALQHHIAYIPKNRKENGIVADLSVEDNILLSVFNHFSKCGVIRPRLRDQVFKKLASQVGLKYSKSTDFIGTLSGGNQQKALIARALSSQPKLVVFDNPTQGVDIGSKAEIYEQIQLLTGQGVAFAVLSNEFDELRRLCDRVYIMYQGRVVHELSHNELNEEEIMFFATGGTANTVIKEVRQWKK